MQSVLVACATLAAPGSASSDVSSCRSGGSDAVPLAWSHPGTWEPAGVPDATTDVLLAAACHVRCESGVCAARTVRGTHAGASLEIAPGAALELAGCENADASNPVAYECGGENAFTFRPRGALLHDSALDGDVILGGVSMPDAPARMRLALARAIGAAPGDWLQIRSGRARNQVYRVEAVQESGCPDPFGCFLDVSLHDPDMEFGRSPATQGLATTIASLAAPAAARVGSPRDSPRCVELCSMRSGDDCIEASVLARDHSYVGWSFAAGTPHPADPATSADAALIVESFDDVPESIGPGSGLVDRICFAEPVPAAWTPARGHRDVSAVIWPGWKPGDGFVLFRPATVRSTGPERDAGLGFHGACVDADFAYFDGWAKISNRFGTPACQAPYEDTVIVADARGLPPDRFDQQAGCNGHSLDIWNFAAFRGDRVALVDTRAPVDASATCLRDPEPDDGDPTSSTHGLALSATRFDPEAPPAHWLVRHAADDGVIIGSATLGSGVWTLRDWVFWYDAQGYSTEVVDFLSSAPGQVVRIENGTVVSWAGQQGCQAAFNDAQGHVRFEIRGLLYIDPRFDGPVLGDGDAGGHDVIDLLAFGGSAGTCSAVSKGRIRSSWLSGWRGLIDGASRGVEGVYFGASETAGPSRPILGTPAGATSVLARDFVLTGLPPIPLSGSACPIGCDLAVRDGFAAWREPYPFGVANFYPTANVRLAVLEGLLLDGAGLIGCSTGAGESGASVGTNLLVRPPGGIAIRGGSACPDAAPQIVVDRTGRASPTPFRADLFGGRFGPRGRVGLSASQRVTVDAALHDSFAIVPEVCANGIDDDWDGFPDRADPGCRENDASESSVGWPCDDGLDGDGDGLVDAAFDPGCPTPWHPTEAPACDDGLDNDGDGAADFEDASCFAPWVATESSCGLGGELVVALFAARTLRKTARRGAARPAARLPRGRSARISGSGPGRPL
jgi:hypothetical protein